MDTHQASITRKINLNDFFMPRLWVMPEDPIVPPNKFTLAPP